MLDGEWHHVAASFGPGGMQLYVDGEHVDADDYTGGLGSTSGGAGNSEPIILGASNNGAKKPGETRYHFKGALDDVRVYDRALAAKEIAELARR